MTPDDRARVAADLRALARTEAETARILREAARITGDPQVAARRRDEADEADRVSALAMQRADLIDPPEGPPGVRV